MNIISIQLTKGVLPQRTRKLTMGTASDDYLQIASARLASLGAFSWIARILGWSA
jgi:hypothetical protein